MELSHYEHKGQAASEQSAKEQSCESSSQKKREQQQELASDPSGPSGGKAKSSEATR